MKKVLSKSCGIFVMLSISIGLLLSCTGIEETDYYPSANATALLSVGQTSITLGAKGQNTTVKLTSNVQWVASTDASWCKLAISSGTGSSDIIVETEDNLSAEARTCNVVITAGDKTVSIQITQNAGSLPNVTINGILEIARNSAKVTGNFSSDFPIIECGVVYGTTESLQSEGTKFPSVASGTYGALDITVQNLKSGTLYYACCYVTNALGTSYSKVMSFKTLGEIPGENDNPIPSI